MLRIVGITLATLITVSVAHAAGQYAACKHTDPSGNTTWTEIDEGEDCDPLDIKGHCDKDGAGALINCTPDNGL